MYTQDLPLLCMGLYPPPLFSLPLPYLPPPLPACLFTICFLGKTRNYLLPHGFCEPQHFTHFVSADPRKSLSYQMTVSSMQVEGTEEKYNCQHDRFLLGLRGGSFVVHRREKLSRGIWKSPEQRAKVDWTRPADWTCPGLRKWERGRDRDWREHSEASQSRER